MHRDSGHEPGVGIVEFILYSRRAVLLHSRSNGGDADGLSFGDVQLFKEIAYPSVSILPGTNETLGEIGRFQGPAAASVQGCDCRRQANPVQRYCPRLNHIGSRKGINNRRILAGSKNIFTFAVETISGYLRTIIRHPSLSGCLFFSKEHTFFCREEILNQGGPLFYK